MSSEKIFMDFIPIYQDTLIKAGYNHKLTYRKHDQKTDNSQKGKWQIILFNHGIVSLTFYSIGW